MNDLAEVQNQEQALQADESQWRSAAKRIAEFIPCGAVVRDFRLNYRSLDSHLPTRCTYLPFDVSLKDGKISEGAPPLESATHITMLGLLDDLAQPTRLLRQIRKYNCPVICNYRPRDLAVETLERERHNRLDLDEFVREIGRAGYSLTQLVRVDSFQVLARLEPGAKPSTATPRVLVLSGADVGNFGDRLGYHLINEVLPAEIRVDHMLFPTRKMPDETYDLLVLGIGGSIFRPFLRPPLFELVKRMPKVVGIFGTQYREEIDDTLLGRLLDHLTIWFARYEEDALLYGKGRDVVHLGDWLIDAFPITQGREIDFLEIGDEIWNDLPLDRTIQRIQRCRRVYSLRLHPLLCALTSAEEVAYREQRETSGRITSGKFRSMLLDVFGRHYPEEQFFAVDRGAVGRYKAYVKRNILAMRKTLKRMLLAPNETILTRIPE